jgi:molecular chaperone GrpE
MPKKDDQQDQDLSESLADKVEEVSMDDLQDKIKELQQEDQGNQAEEEAQMDQDDSDNAKIQELTDALARAMADLQNFKRRSEEDKTKWIKFANGELLKELIGVIDHFDLSAKHLPDDLKGNEWVKGVMQIHTNFSKMLEKMGVVKMKCVGQPLNPNRHEAMLSGPGKKDVVTEIFEAGYLYHDQVLRPAKVKVGNGSAT